MFPDRPSSFGTCVAPIFRRSTDLMADGIGQICLLKIFDFYNRDLVEVNIWLMLVNCLPGSPLFSLGTKTAWFLTAMTSLADFFSWPLRSSFRSFEAMSNHLHQSYLDKCS